MKKVFLVALLFVGITTFAQDKKERNSERPKLSTADKVEKQVEKLKTELALNEKQLAEVKVLVTEQITKREAKHAEMKAKKENEKAEMKKVMMEDRKALNEKMKKILTPEQFIKWEAKREEMKEKMISKMKDKKRNTEQPEDKL